MNRQPTPKSQPDVAAGREIRCERCNRLLLKHVAGQAAIEIMCKCKHLQVIELAEIPVHK
jgi:phage FluMu protein Com